MANEVTDRIRAIARRRRVPKTHEKAAYATGRVETGNRNLPGGDADSAGWRQERASLYKDPQNLDASINRFFDETAKLDRGQNSAELAADVQRPAAQYRHRYGDRAVQREAQQLLESGSSKPSKEATKAPTSPTAESGVDAATARRAALQKYVLNSDVDPDAALTLATEITAARKVKDAPAPDARTAITQRRSTKKSNGDGVVPLGGSKNAGKGAFKIEGPNPERLQKGLVSFAKKGASIYGGTWTGKDGSSHSKFTVNGNVSDHHSGNATDVFFIDGKPAEGERLIKAGRAALIAAGMPREQALKAPGGLYNVGGHQIIFGVDGAANGGNHKDHLHISAR